jgi:hypothetical protein
MVEILSGTPLGFGNLDHWSLFTSRFSGHLHLAVTLASLADIQHREWQDAHLHLTRVTGTKLFSHVIRLLWEIGPYQQERHLRRIHLTNIKYDSSVDDRTLQQAVKLYEERVDLIAAWLFRRAQHLVLHFREARENLQKEAAAEIAAKAMGPRHARRLYAPLTPFARFHRHCLEICWQQVHYTRVGKKAKFYYVKKSQRGDYNIQLLAAKARPYEQELVVWTETEAAVLRKRWRAVVRLRRAIRELDGSIRSRDS